MSQPASGATIRAASMIMRFRLPKYCARSRGGTRSPTSTVHAGFPKFDMKDRMPFKAMMSVMAPAGRDVTHGTSARARRATRAKPPTVHVTRGFRRRAASAARAPGKRETAPRSFCTAASSPSWLVLAPYASA
jgi:hypothetical protein